MRASVLVLCATALVLLGISSSSIRGSGSSSGSGVWAAEQSDNCVAETPFVSFVDVVSDDKRVGIGGLNENGEPENVLKIQVGSRSVPSALYARFTAKNGVILEVNQFYHLPGSSVYIMEKLLTAMEPGGQYIIQLLRFTDLAGGVTEITDFSRFGASDNFYVAVSRPQLEPQLLSLSWNLASNTIDLRDGQDVSVVFTFRVALGTPKLSNGQPNWAVGPYVQQTDADVPLVGLGKFTFTYACQEDPSVPPLTFTATNATLEKLRQSDGSFIRQFRGTAMRIIAPGTRECTNYKLANPMYLSDSSIFSMRFPTELNPDNFFNLITSFRIGNSGSDTTLPQLTAPVTFTVLNSTHAPGVANTTFSSRTVYVWFRATDPVVSGQRSSGVDSITFSGAFSTGLVTNGVVTKAHLVDATTGLYAYPILLPHGFPPATWSFTSAIAVKDRAQNTFSVSSASSFSVACGNPIFVEEDDHSTSTASNSPTAKPILVLPWWQRTWALALGGSLAIVVLAMSTAACVYVVRRRRTSTAPPAGVERTDSAGAAAGGTGSDVGTGTGSSEMASVTVTGSGAAPSPGATAPARDVNGLHAVSVAVTDAASAPPQRVVVVHLP